MNHSLYSADRTTHSKIVVLALICATTVAGIGIAAHSGRGDGLEQSQHVSVLRAGQSTMMASSVQPAIR
jgi:hypothetical protein